MPRACAGPDTHTAVGICDLSFLQLAAHLATAARAGEVRERRENLLQETVDRRSSDMMKIEISEIECYIEFCYSDVIFLSFRIGSSYERS